MTVTSFLKTAAISCFAVALCPLLGQAKDSSSDSNPLPHLHTISSVMYIGGPPTAKGVSKLYNMHVTQVVDLRVSPPASEGEQVERLGSQNVGTKFSYVNLPLGNRVPTEEEISKFISIVDVSPEQKTDWMPASYVHGDMDPSLPIALIGIWRIKHDGWNFDKVYSQMKNAGFDTSRTELTDLVKKHSHQ